MIKIIFSMLMLSISWAAYAQIKVPALSPSIEISQKIGLTTAKLSYSRPSLHGRQLFGEEGILVIGKKWRTGANATTKVEFTSDVELSGQLLAKGVYALLSTPQEHTWTFHFYPYEKGSYTQFLEQEPILNITVPIQKLDYSLETLSLHFEALTLQTAHLVLQWANYKVAIPLQLNEHAAILADIKKHLEGPSHFDYFQAALYLHETQTDLLLALSYIRKATQHEKALFFQVYREALILKDLNQKAEAIEVAKRSLALSKQAKNDDFTRLSQQVIDELTQ